ncbi:hypothetical protein [Cellulophaga sp. L1A9]|uniref:hypothetical protein n=1 Tax=Cellulophaga sp. L1A9 TaxID=2686362 RepID=UPI001E38FC8A|nr:hypothetical protein [Cellulophaga sp. L1A9]
MGKNGVSTAYEHEVTLDSYSISKYEKTWEEFNWYFLLNDMDIINPQYRGKIKDYGASWEIKTIQQILSNDIIFLERNNT